MNVMEEIIQYTCPHCGQIELASENFWPKCDKCQGRMKKSQNGKIIDPDEFGRYEETGSNLSNSFEDFLRELGPHPRATERGPNFPMAIHRRRHSFLAYYDEIMRLKKLEEGINALVAK